MISESTVHQQVGRLLRLQMREQYFEEDSINACRRLRERFAHSLYDFIEVKSTYDPPSRKYHAVAKIDLPYVYDKEMENKEKEMNYLKDTINSLLHDIELLERPWWKKLIDKLRGNDE